MIGDPVKNSAGEDLGEVKELMIDYKTGDIVYAVLSFGGILGLGDKLFAIPWPAIRVDTENRCFVVNLERERLERAPGFDKDHCPDMADRAWGERIYAYYGIEPHWAYWAL
jgi:hypothetical protein